jgi:hypothetical protein
VRIGIDSLAKDPQLNSMVLNSLPETTHATDGQQEVQEAKEKNYQGSVGGGFPKFFNIGFNGGYKTGRTTKYQVSLSEITCEIPAKGQVYWLYYMGNNIRRDTSKDFPEKERPSATFKFSRKDDDPVVLPPSIQLDIASFWSCDRKKMEASPEQVKKYSFRNFCHVLFLEIPSNLTKDIDYNDCPTVHLGNRKPLDGKQSEFACIKSVDQEELNLKEPIARGEVAVTTRISGMFESDLSLYICMLSILYLRKRMAWYCCRGTSHRGQ